ncbi:uncharacterized protein LOC130674465 [Microplitis mediator]|uniref:uncharacterized protein LOC130674465 n=1 Tax=Microplitis mediator TaxID=375433 RepID=UPI002554933E|nr:uncharacterized protein LOC130674465 [Microplitis mediator]
MEKKIIIVLNLLLFINSLSLAIPLDDNSDHAPEQPEGRNAKQLRDFCATDDHCSLIKNSVCTEEGCICPEDFDEVNNTCVKRNGPFCFDNSDCKHVEGVEIACLLGACQSTLEFFSSKNEANIASYSAKNLNDPCGKNEHCKVENSFCSEAGCICSENFTTVGNSCVAV